MKKRRTYAILVSSMALATGLSIYLLYRPQGAFFVEQTGLQTYLPDLPGYVTGSLPDGLWMFSASVVVLLIWDFRVDLRSGLWLTFLLAIGFASEILQVNGIIPGVYDPVDMLCIGLGFALGVLVVANRGNLISTAISWKPTLG